MTVLEVIQRSTDYLAGKGVESPRLQIESMLAQVLQLPRLKLYLSFERILTERELGTARAMVKRRGQREPLQHILGSTSFCGLEMVVNRDVFIPRPETELLAERAWQFLSELDSLARDREDPFLSVLDFGTGSGCLAVTLAVKCSQAQVHALDISEAALKVARQNATRHQVTERIQFYCGDGFAALPCGLRFDLILSNPPYIPSAVIETLQPEVRDYDPRAALDGGRDGLTVIRRLATEAPPFLAPDGRLMMEFGDEQEKPVRELFLKQAWGMEAVGKDYAGRPRILIAQRSNS